MKCISKYLVSGLLFVSLLFSTTGCGKEAEPFSNPYPVYSTSATDFSLQGEKKDALPEYFASSLCVGGLTDVGLETTDAQVCEGAGLFNTATNQILYAKNIYGKLYPASTTKILTCYIALQYGNLDDIVTVSEKAADMASDSSVCGVKAGDKITLRDLLYGLMMESGNDAAIAIAEHISGDTDTFAGLMNNTAASLGATTSHFVNPNGLPDDNHYTSVYDLYLITNAAMQNQTFLDIINTNAYTANYTDASGAPVSQEWTSTNKYSAGTETAPDGITVIGGKTGTTGEAGYCLVLLSKNSSGQNLISIVLKADCKSNLYLLMNEILQQYGNS